ncbi:TyeA family type III secretion system gatekeeper subunit [Pseudomonas sp. MWU15-20650]|uniref:TyeA family type III secretion system gatekeeper subunit n=1 Tax=Pseudomonas sp. MWU15-20650 TaxID=2933107 RepID=UPI00200FD910|nr:TyeA family type III secretion system gatekeeper subunit [Pseudomonas sp. MWU15-20650]
MKIESANDVQQILSSDQPRVSAAPTQPKAAGVDDIAQIFSEEVSSNTIALKRRVIGSRVEPVMHLVELYEQLGHPAQTTLASIARLVRLQLLLWGSTDKSQSLTEKLLDLTENDPARTFVVLKFVAAEAQAQARKAEEKMAREALEKLEIRFKLQIQAGLNIAAALQLAGGNPNERQAVRELYYASVVTRQSLALMMQSLLGVFGDERFADGLNLMRRALADDIAANTPSVPTALLRTLLLGLQSCSNLSTALAACKKLIPYLKAQQDAVTLLKCLLGYISAGIASSEVQRLAHELGGEQVASQLVSLNALYPVIKDLPRALWLDPQGRQDALDHFLLVMDAFTRSERGHPQFAGDARARG